MIQNKNQNIIYLVADSLYGYVMSRFLPTSRFNSIGPKDFDSNKYSSNSSKGFVSEIGFQYSKEVRE